MINLWNEISKRGGLGAARKWAAERDKNFVEDCVQGMSTKELILKYDINQTSVAKLKRKYRTVIDTLKKKYAKKSQKQGQQL